ncbi:hypothetical protein D3C75_637810 [compost metagenome]
MAGMHLCAQPGVLTQTGLLIRGAGQQQGQRQRQLLRAGQQHPQHLPAAIAHRLNGTNAQHQAVDPTGGIGLMPVVQHRIDILQPVFGRAVFGIELIQQGAGVQFGKGVDDHRSGRVCRQLAAELGQQRLVVRKERHDPRRAGFFLQHSVYVLMIRHVELTGRTGRLSERLTCECKMAQIHNDSLWYFINRISLLKVSDAIGPVNLRPGEKYPE